MSMESQTDERRTTPAACDVLIAGGGMVGAALACALGDSELRVVLVEPVATAPLLPGAPAQCRVSAIARASQRVFAAVGAWERMLELHDGQGRRESRVCAYRGMEVWDAGGPGRIHFDAAEVGEECLGWIIENDVIQAALLQRAGEFANIERVSGVAVSGIVEQADGVEVQLADGRAWRAALLVGADGANSQVRRWAGFDTAGWGYAQHAVVCPVRTALPHADTAWQRFLPSGPLAFLPLFDGRSSIVWSTTPEQAARLLRLDEAAFALELGEAFEYRLGQIEAVGERAAFPLRLQHSPQYVKPRIALIGDAAHVVHPLAGQGVNLGLLDAASLAEIVLQAHAGGRDVGGLQGLRHYERWRKGDNLLMLAAMDGFKRVFGSSLAPVRAARSAGLLLANAIEPLKRLLVRRALGLSGELPRLARAV